MVEIRNSRRHFAHRGKVLVSIPAGVLDKSWDEVLKKYYKTDNIHGFKSCASKRVVLEKSNGGIVIVPVNMDCTVRDIKDV